MEGYLAHIEPRVGVIALYRLLCVDVSRPCVCLTKVLPRSYQRRNQDPRSCLARDIGFCVRDCGLVPGHNPVQQYGMHSSNPFKVGHANINALIVKDVAFEASSFSSRPKSLCVCFGGNKQRDPPIFQKGIEL